MIPLSWLLCGAIIALGLIGFLLGRLVGREEGYERGYLAGYRKAGLLTWERVGPPPSPRR